MTKLSIGRLLETSKFLATAAGKELADFIVYMSDVSEQVLRTLRNGVGLDDNIDGKRVTVAVKHNVEAVVNTGGRVPIAMWCGRVISTTTGVDGFSWYQNAQGQVVVKVALVGAPVGTFEVVLVMFMS